MRYFGTGSRESVLQLVYCKVKVGADLRGGAALVEQSKCRSQVL